MVFLIYPITCINAFQCSMPGLDWKRESNNTGKARSGHVASWPHMTEPSTEVFTFPHSFRPETSVSERFRAVLLGNSHICSECSISEVRANFRNSSEFFRPYSDQFRATGRNHSDMIRTYSEQIPSKFRSYPSILIRAIPNKDQWLQSTNEILYYYYNIYVVQKFAMSKD